MLNILKQSFMISNKYIILATPLIIFSLLSSFYIIFSANGTLLGLIFALILFSLMFVAFLSGWFCMVKDAISDEYPNEPNSLIKKFPEGVGEYFLPVSGMIFISFVFSSAIYILIYLLGIKYIGDIGISLEKFSQAMESTAALKLFVASLTKEQIIKINLWNLLILLTTAFIYYILMFYPTALFYKQKNPFKAFFVGLKDLFCRRFFKNLFLYTNLFVSYIILSIFTTIFGHNIIMHFIFTLVNFYYLVVVAVFVFNYYYNNYICVGKNIDKVL